MGYPIIEILNLGYTKLENFGMGYPWYNFLEARPLHALFCETQGLMNVFYSSDSLCRARPALGVAGAENCLASTRC